MIIMSMITSMSISIIARITIDNMSMFAKISTLIITMIMYPDHHVNGHQNRRKSPWSPWWLKSMVTIVDMSTITNLINVSIITMADMSMITKTITMMPIMTMSMITILQSWALSVFFNFFTNKNLFFASFIKLFDWEWAF